MNMIRAFIIALSSMLVLSSCQDGDIHINSTLKDEIANQEYVAIIENNLSHLPKNAQVSIAIIEDSSSEYIGVLNDGNVLSRTANENKVFEIGSITKVFTSVCLSSLIATNEASLTETLQSQFDFPLKAGGNISLLQLANHTSGLPRLPTNGDEIVNFDPSDPYANYDFNILKSYLQNHITLNSAIGSQYEYSNLGTGILGYILAKKKGGSYEALLKNLIFEPLQMSNSTTLLDQVDPSKLVPGHDANGNIVSNWNFTEVANGTGSIKSTVVDLEKFVYKNFEDDAVYNLPQTSTFDRGQGFFMGLGWSIQEDEDIKLLYHDGGTGGYSSFLIMNKKYKTAVIVLSNFVGVDADSEKITQLGTDLFVNVISP